MLFEITGNHLVNMNNVQHMEHHKDMLYITFSNSIQPLVINMTKDEYVWMCERLETQQKEVYNS